MAVHFWRIRKDGGISGPKVETREMRKARDVVKKMQIKRPEFIPDEELEEEGEVIANDTNGTGTSGAPAGSEPRNDASETV